MTVAECHALAYNCRTLEHLVVDHHCHHPEMCTVIIAINTQNNCVYIILLCSMDYANLRNTNLQ